MNQHGLSFVLACRSSGVDWGFLFITGAMVAGVSWLIVAVCQGIFGRDTETMLRSCAEKNICFECKYDLRGIGGGICPECGTKTPGELLR